MEFPNELNFMNNINQLALNDMTKYEEILDLPWIFCLNKLLLDNENSKKSEWEIKNQTQ